MSKHNIGRTVNCIVCDEPVGRPGDKPAIKFGEHSYRHKSCRPKEVDTILEQAGIVTAKPQLWKPGDR